MIKFRNILLTLLLLIHMSLCYAQVSIYDGKIGEFPVHMEISAEDFYLSGFYNYPGKSQDLRLTGVLNADYSFTINERTKKGNLTGSFTGEILPDGSLTGKWRNSSLTKELNFSLQSTNNIPLKPTIPSISNVDPDNVEKQNLKDQLYGESRVKGFSRIALLIVALLLIGIGIFAYFLYKRKKQGPEIITKVTKVIEKQKIYINTEMAESWDLHKDIGDSFENFVIDKFAKNKEYYTLKERRSDKIHNGISAEANSYPDLIYRFHNQKQQKEAVFAVECKFRSTFYPKRNYITIDNARKLDNYRKYQEEYGIPVFIALGFKGTPEEPKHQFIIPLDDIEAESFSIYELRKYKSDRPYFYFNYVEGMLR